MKDYSENKQIIPLSPGACLRVAASAKAGERAGVRGKSRPNLLKKFKKLNISSTDVK